METLSTRPNRNGYEQHLTNLFCRHFGSQMSAHFRISFHQLNSHEVCCVQADPAPRPVYVEEDGAVKMYVRVGNTSKPLNPQEAVEYVRGRWKSN
jgi:hypothetical protein